MKTTLSLCLVAIAFLASKTSQAVDVVWDFAGANPLESTDGSRFVTYYDPLSTGWGPVETSFGDIQQFSLTAFPDGGAGRVMQFPATTPSEGYRIEANAGLTEAYTMIWDYYSPSSSDGQWRALLQTNTSNSNDGDFFIRNQSSGGIGISGNYSGAVIPDAWNRIAMTRQANGVMNKYINGSLVGTQDASSSRFALDSHFYILTDENNETQPGFLGSYRFADRALSSEEIRQLGNVSSMGAATPGPTIPDPPGPPSDPLFGRTLVVAHRGGGFLAPENTLAAIEKGFEAGADHMEIDIQLTADGHAVVFHDSTLDRTTNGTGPIANLTLAEVKQLDAGSWFGSEFAGEKVPTLTEALEYIDGRCRLLLDVKVSASQALRDAIATSLTESGASVEDIWVWPPSNNYTNDPRFGNAEIQLLSSVPSDLSDSNLQALKAQGIDGLSVTHGSISQQAIDAFHRNDMYVDVYTVNDTARMQQLIAMGVDSIETDRPDLMSELLFAGDYNGDGGVNIADYTVWRNSLGSTVPPGTGADGNASGRVDQLDYDNWRRNFGKSLSEFSSETEALRIPEPATVALLLTTLVWGCARRFRTRL
ncbi:glycerophosphodiester phosphodiesterase family protein [Aeoliella sp.]|uniref:glycerophosphodiester phosphodiesterase family protein n=1 Tax=Aeoliella sp. TaxID=2795800 RepID=UPI003CCBC53F